MARYKLLAGMHIQADKTRPLKDAEGKPTGRFERRAFKTGDVVESDVNLVERHGPEKFQALDGPDSQAADRIRELESEIVRLKATQAAASAGGFRTPGDPTPENLAKNPSVAPGGQVSTGFQGGPPEGADVVADADDGLDALTVQELKDTAADEEIPLHGAKTKDDIVAAIRKGRK